VLTDGFLRVLGSNNSIWAFGDAATIAQPKAVTHADEMFEYADANADGRVSLVELQRVLRAASKRYSHLEEHALHLEAKNSK
jgi:Ca2+-binding EF-hand superfamily protein